MLANYGRNGLGGRHLRAGHEAECTSGVLACGCRSGSDGRDSGTVNFDEPWFLQRIFSLEISWKTSLNGGLTLRHRSGCAAKALDASHGTVDHASQFCPVFGGAIFA